jgi:hypothetical protein
MAKIRPDSLTPRRLPIAMIVMNPTAIGQQRDAGHLRGDDAEVVLGDDVRAARRGIGLDGLAVAEHQDHQHAHQRDGDRHDVAEGQQTDTADEQQGAQDLLGGVRGGGQGVGGEDGQRRRFAEALVGQLVVVERLAEDLRLDPEPPRFGEVDP